MVKQYSGGPNADKGGDLGEYPKGQLPKVIEDQVFALQPGQWTTPVRTRQGFVIEAVTEHNSGGVQPLSAVDQQVQEAIYKEAIEPALRTYLTDLREKAYIYIEPGFVDTGASPRETKSVYVGATPPPAKKKSAKARLDAKRTAAASKSQVASGATPAAPSTTTPASASLMPVKLTKSGKPKKVKREKIRFGQAPRNSLPSAPGETLAAGADQGAGATGSILPAPAPGAAMATEQTASTSSDLDPLAAAAPAKGKTRYSDRAPIEAKEKAAEKAAKVKQKAAAAPPPLTAEETATEKLQRAPLEPATDTKKKKRVKGAPKERIQEKAPAAPAPKPEANPIPPKSVRDNGEPVVTPPPNPSTLPPVTAPAPGSPVNTTPATPANPAPAPVPPQ
jgi:peptidyl-prolyl cis-trans isomerase SurA